MTPEPSHFDNPLVEQRKLLTGEAALKWAERSVLEIRGEKSASWLHSLLSQNIVNIAVGGSTEALLLDPQGRIQQLVHLVVVAGDKILLALPTSKATELTNWLRSMVFRSGVTVTDVSDQFQLFGAFAPIAEFDAYPCFIDSWPQPRPGGVRYGSWTQAFPYREYFAPKATQLPERLAPAGQLAFDALRIWAGRPVVSDFDERALPHEFDLLSSAVHLSKGCYRGQETVAKVHNLGHPPRRLVLLELDAAESLPSADDVVAEAQSGREVGKVLAAAQHFEAGPIALALVSRNTIPDATLHINTDHGQLIAHQQLLVPPSAGGVVERPKLPKLHLGSKR